MRNTAAAARGLVGALRLILAVLVATVALSPAQALDPQRTFGQFHHTRWSGADGLGNPAGVVVQTPDGFLWVASGDGLFRFDGIRSERFDLGLPNQGVQAMAVAADGDIWIGQVNATLVRIRNNRVSTFSVPTTGDRTPVLFLAPDREGGLWLSTRDHVRHFDGRVWTQIEAPWPRASTWSDPGGVWGLALARDGTLWAKNLLGLYVLRRGARAFEPVPGYGGGLVDFARAPDGRLWTGDFATRRFYALPDVGPGGPIPAPQLRAPVPPEILGSIMIDRDGGLWNPNRVTGGLFRLPSVTVESSVERYDSPHESLVEFYSQVFEDREGAIWVSSAFGIERFRSANIVPETRIRIRPQAAQIVSTSDAVYVYSGMSAPIPIPGDAGQRLFRIRPGARPELISADVGQVEGMAATRDGAIVIASEGRLRRWKDGVFSSVALPPALQGAHIVNLVSTPDGGLLVSAYGRGAHRLQDGRWTDITPASVNAALSPTVGVDGQGAAWLFYPGGRIVRVWQGRTTVFPPDVARRVGSVTAILPEGNGFWAVSNTGISWFDGHQFRFLGPSRGAAMPASFGIVRSANGDLWLGSLSSIRRISRAALLEAFRRPEADRTFQVFDAEDGLTRGILSDVLNNGMTTGPDGRVWFLTLDGVAWIDPARLYRNQEPPPVVIRSLLANGRAHDRPSSLTLPGGTSQMQIDYTALSVAAPERVRFRYRLEGVDRDWVEAGSRRQAFYTNLQPGSYHFQVIAANGDGVWNNTGASLSVRLEPTFWQTWIFKVLIGLVALALLWMLYRLRLQQVAGRIRMRLAERMDERERIARELHDTLLQGVQGLTLKLQSLADQMPRHEPARALMEQALDRADEVLAEGRDRVRNLRSAAQDGDLSAALEAAALRLRIDPSVEVTFTAAGERRALHPVVFDEVLSVAGEALFNAFTHSGAGHVSVEVSYAERQLTVAIGDDGRGIQADILEQGRAGHFGIAGMRERARRVRGQLSIRSGPGEGTRIILTVPGSHAYAAGRRIGPFALRRLELED